MFANLGGVNIYATEHESWKEMCTTGSCCQYKLALAYHKVRQGIPRTEKCLQKEDRDLMQSLRQQWENLTLKIQEDQDWSLLLGQG